MNQGDSETTVQQLKDLIRKFSDERGWQRHHTPKNLAISISLEAAELLEHFQWDEYHQEDKQQMADELADILAYAFHFANIMDINITAAYTEKLKRAEKKYPPELFNKDKLATEDYFRIKRSYRQKDTEA